MYFRSTTLLLGCKPALLASSTENMSFLLHTFVMAPVKLIELKSEVMFASWRIERSGSGGVECPFVGGE